MIDEKEKAKMLKFIKSRNDINKAQFERALGMPNSSFTKWVNGSQEIGDHWLQSIQERLITHHCYHCIPVKFKS